MAALDDYVDDVDEPEPEPERVALPRKAEKIASKRGRSQKAHKKLVVVLYMLCNSPSGCFSYVELVMSLNLKWW